MKNKDDYNAYMRVYHLKRYYKIKKQAKELLGGCCVKCGSIKELEFDHIDPSTKELEISKAFSCSSDVFWNEVSKCQLLCKSCHNKKSILERGNKIAVGTHGTLSSYRYCKCDLCRKAKSDWMKEYKKRKKQKNKPLSSNG